LSTNTAITDFEEESDVSLMSVDRRKSWY